MLRAWTGALAVSVCCSAAWPQSAPKASDAWARPTVAGQAMGGAYLTLVGGATADRLLEVRADVSASVELHRMAMEGDMMRMRRVEAIEVPAGKTVKLEPGGLHVMFVGLKAPLAVGKTFPLVLRFEKGGEATVQVQVRTAAAPAGAMHRP